jgi:hypothetical protein
MRRPEKMVGPKVDVAPERTMKPNLNLWIGLMLVVAIAVVLYAILYH